MKEETTKQIIGVENLREKVDEYVLNHKQEIMCYVSLMLRENHGTQFVSYEWENNDCPYDDSGSLYRKGYVDIHTVTMEEFSEDCYTGNSTATYISGSGLSWDTFDKDLCDYFSEKVICIQNEAIANMFENKQQMQEFCKKYDYECDSDEVATIGDILANEEETIANDLSNFPLDIFPEIKIMSVEEFLKLSDCVCHLIENRKKFLRVDEFMKEYEKISSYGE